MVHARIAVFSLIAMTSMRAGFGAEAALQQDSVGRLGVATLLELMRITADRCSDAVPNLKEEFDALVASQTPRIWSIGNDLLLSDNFKDLRNEPVSAAMADVMRKEFQSFDAIHAKTASVASCSGELSKLRKFDDAAIKKELGDSFSIMRAILNDTKSGRVR